MHQLIFGNRFDEFPWSVNNLDLVLENIPSFFICEFVYTANFFICLVHLLYQKDERVRMQQGWTLMTNMPTLMVAMRARECDGKHEHQQVAGKETKKTEK